MAKVLIHEEPYKPEVIYPWSTGIIRRFHMDEADVEWLETGNTLLRGDTAFSLEEDDNA